ncbi:2394_t:CDS:2 [Ambispora leptoticha]|uniref:2394_t:CDS:1 n=1 Tax=Ambispora leptoticha TaxID=144679 RepID=A0A9N9FU31_9GLOM|nr:2394_t:CDS:2 [Ambispora leptoticha]
MKSKLKMQDNNNESSNLEYDTAKEKPDIYFKKIKNLYINRIAEAGKFNEEKIINIYKRQLALKDKLKHETIEIIRKDQINIIIEKEYNEIID